MYCTYPCFYFTRTELQLPAEVSTITAESRDSVSCRSAYAFPASLHCRYRILASEKLPRVQFMNNRIKFYGFYEYNAWNNGYRTVRSWP